MKITLQKNLLFLAILCGLNAGPLNALSGTANKKEKLIQDIKWLRARVKTEERSITDQADMAGAEMAAGWVLTYFISLLNPVWVPAGVAVSTCAAGYYGLSLYNHSALRARLSRKEELLKKLENNTSLQNYPFQG